MSDADLDDLDLFDSDIMESKANAHTLLKIVILAVIGVVSVVGNLIAVGTLIYYKSLRISIYIVIGGLALADIMVAVINIPEEIINHAQKGELKSEDWCKAYGFLSDSGQYIVAFHLVFLSVLRSILLTDRSHHGPTVIHTYITCAVLWITSLLANIPMITSSILDPIMKKCVVLPGLAKQVDGLPMDEKSEKESMVEELYIILSAAFSYFLPLVLIIIIYCFTRYMSKRFYEDSYSLRERRMSRMINSLILTFTLCHLPAELVMLFWFYTIKDKSLMETMSQDTQKYVVFIHVRQYLSILAMVDMALRPIIYATMSRELGVVFDRVINCTFCKQDDEDTAPRMKRRRGEIEEVMQTPLNQPPPQDAEEEIEEIF